MHLHEEHEELFKQYELIRDYVKHEDDLINQRTTWHLSVQGFLVAAYGLTLQKIADFQASFYYSCTQDKTKSCSMSQIHELTAYDRLIWFCFFLCVMGFILAIVSQCGIHAARHALEQLHEDWNIRIREFSCDPADWPTENRKSVPYLPDVIRGGRHPSEMHEHFQMYGMCWLFCMAWVVAFVFVLFVKA